jgi:DNA-binding transcriptional LysR family regulator
LGIVRLASWVVWEDLAAGRLIELPQPRDFAEPAEDGIFVLRALAKPTATFQAFITALKSSVGQPPVWSAPETGHLSYGERAAGEMPGRSAEGS